MLSVAEARARILAEMAAVPAEMVALAEADGRVLAAPLHARLATPPHDVSAMDGYAVLAASAGAPGQALRVVGAAPAGRPWQGRAGAGEAVRIFTGGVVPEGCDSVVVQEDAAQGADGTVTFRVAPVPGRHIRRAGQDFRAGDRLLAPGTVLHARAIALAAAANHPWLAVHRRPRVAILATGDEIALPGEPIADGGLANSNGPGLAALVRAVGAQPMLLPVAHDDPAALARAIEAASGADLLVTTGGASVGEHDLVRGALQARGMALDFWRVAMRPGKPLLFGWLGALPVLGLPGNPVSALVTGLLFLRPALLRLSGRDAGEPPTVLATLAAPVAANDLREDYLRARLMRDATGWAAEALPVQDSSMLRALAEADGLIVRPPHAPAVAAGAAVPVIRFADVGV